MVVTSSEQLITLDDWRVVCVNSHEAWLQYNSRPLLQVALTINGGLQYLALDRRKQVLEGEKH